MNLAYRHRVAGWLSLGLFATLGMVLEALLAFKTPSYIGAIGELRRNLWTLAHAHGTLISLIHLAFAAHISERRSPKLSLASPALFVALVVMPAGFLLGGAFPSESDPGIGIWLVPLGGLSLVGACILLAIDATQRHGD
ncbi:MAG: hypothetical protein AAFQ77_00425 [Myxococcota bacterium]